MTHMSDIIKTRNPKDLRALFVALSQNPGWLSRWSGRLKLTPKEEEILTEMADAHRDLEAWRKDDLRTWVKPRVRALRAEVAPPARPGGLTLTQIEAARAFPLEKLLPEGKPGNRRCLFPDHQDRTPSMQVKNGFGFCHGCNRHMDAIRYLEIVRGLTFPQAVLELSK